MCGIVGWVAYDRDLRHEQRVIEAMIDTVARRGPDAAGSWVEKHIALGHRRLAVIDVEGGSQPMVTKVGEKTVALTYGGEIYNFDDLRDELSTLGHRFRTRSDTEVVLRGYIEWGPALAKRLNGMFAFGIWDGRTQQLILVRDRLGIKPLFYYTTPGGVLFGSEPKAILANPLAKTAVDLESMRQMLLLHTRIPGESVWAGIREVRPGTLVTIGPTKISEDYYWKLTAARHVDDAESTIEQVRDLVTDAVRRQLVSDVPICTMLSGGLDSSSVTAIAARQLLADGKRLRTVTADVVGEDTFKPDVFAETEDAPYARQMAEHVGSDHRVVTIDPQRLADAETRSLMVTAKDSPLNQGDRDFTLQLLCEAIRTHSTVVLTGEGADEVFAGYRTFNRKEPGFPWELGELNPLNELLDREFAAKAEMAPYLADQYSRAAAAVERLDDESDEEAVNRTVCQLHITHFLPCLLERKDRASMVCGVEARVPFCDHRLVDYVFNVPWKLKTFDGLGKSLLRAATRELLPPEIAERKKAIFPTTQNVAYVKAIQAQLRGVLDDSSDPIFEIFDKTAVQRLADAPSDTWVGVSSFRLGLLQRIAAERVLNIHAWFDIYRPAVSLS